MAPLSGPDALRILVATDNHVGYQENHAVRGDDSWKTFDEIMTIAKDQDVDMVLLGGDLFDKHTPSRKSMVNVIRSLRANCLGDKPCELEFLGDGSEVFGGTFNHINYEDCNINVAIPVFSIHGNHDEPTGHEFYCALDVIQETGLINYFGRVPKNDKIDVKPILLQKGRTKLAMFGLSNVRDERLFRSFRDGHVKFFQPGQQKTDWFNLMVVHQNHAPRTSTGYLPENFLPDFMDLIVWGHEHDCWTKPIQNPDQGFHVIQPGSSIATQLMPGEAIDKHVGLLTVKGKDFHWDPIRLKTVRPFVMRDIVLHKVPELKAVVKKANNRPNITKYLLKVIEEMIEEARQKWHELQDDETNEAGEEPPESPLPLLRLRVDYTAPDGGIFDCENAQRITNQFIDKVANHEDIIMYHIKKTAARKTKDIIDVPDHELIEQLTLDSAKVEELVREFLTVQSLGILPQNLFSESVNQFVDKDDKNAMADFVRDNLKSHVKHLLTMDDVEKVEIADEVDRNRRQMEDSHQAGQQKRKVRRSTNSKPAEWDSDEDGAWEDQPEAVTVRADHDDDDNDVDMDSAEQSPNPPAPRSRARDGSKSIAKTTARKATAQKQTNARGRGTTSRRANAFMDEDDDEESDVNMLMQNNQDHGDQDEDEDEEVFVQPSRRGKAASSTNKAPPSQRATTTSRAKAKATTAKQATLDFSQHSSTARAPSSRTAAQKKKVIEISDDDISDDDDAFEPVAPVRGTRRR